MSNAFRCLRASNYIPKTRRRTWGTAVQQNKGVDERELTFREIKNLSSEHLILCRAVKTNITGLSETIVKQPMLAHLNNGRFVIVIKVASGENDDLNITFIDPKASNPKPEIIDLKSFKNSGRARALFSRNQRN